MANIIEPCCAERQIGQLFRENRGHAVMFQTHGDVTLENWMKSVMLLSGDRPRTLSFAVPILTTKMMDVIAKYMRLGWVAKLRLLTTDPIIDECIEAFAAKADCDVPSLVERIEFAADKNIPDGLLSFNGFSGVVVIQGRFRDEVVPSLTLYAGTLGNTESPSVRAVMDAWNANFKAHRYEVLADIKTGGEGEAEPAPKRTSRKKKSEI